MEVLNNIREPYYIHREYKYDIGIPSGSSWEKQSAYARTQRVLNFALPFIALHKPISQPFSLVLGGLRTINDFSNLILAVTKGNNSQVAYATLHLSLSAMSVAATVFAHPLGMFISTGQNILIDVPELFSSLQSGNHKQSFEVFSNILNNSLYLACFMHGGLVYTVASLGMQVLIGIYHSKADFDTGNYLEAMGHLTIAMIRGNQMHHQYQMMQCRAKWERILS